jgi:hypothetical protein
VDKASKEAVEMAVFENYRFGIQNFMVAGFNNYYGEVK